MINELSNPVLKTLVNHLRETKTDALRFRHIIHEIARLLTYEALGSETLMTKKIDTWNGEKAFGFIDEESMVFVSILRAGLPMTESVSALFPKASLGFLAMKRDEKTHQSVIYYDRIPECKNKTVLLLDPMVATGGSLCDAISVIKQKGPSKIITLNVIGSPEGLDVVAQKHPDVEVFIAQIDEHLDGNMFIYPGLGDAGDREYNTPE